MSDSPDYDSGEAPRLRIPWFARPAGASDDESGGVGGVKLGTTCHNHVLTEVYADFDGEGHLVALHTHDIGSC